MRKQLYQNMIVRIIDPAVSNAIEKFESVSRVSPKASLKRISGRVAIAHFANVIFFSVVEPINWMLSSFSRFLTGNSCNFIAGKRIVKYQNIATLGFLVVNQWQHVDAAEVRKNGIVKDLLNPFTPDNISDFPLQARIHGITFVRG